MKLTFEELVDELHERSSEELVDLAELAKHFAIQHRRDEILRNGQESLREYQAGNLLPATDDREELKRRLRAA